MKKQKRLLKILFIVIALILILLLINFIPAFRLKTAGMHTLSGRWVNVHYETEKAAAEDVFAYADEQTQYIADKLGFDQKPDVNIYIYDHQSTMQTKKYGLIAPLLHLDWYIGDNIGTNVILTSPANPGKMHDYSNNKYAVLHETVHAYVSVLNKDISLWLTEGMALYLSNGEPFSAEKLNYFPIPSFADTKTVSPIAFANFGGYALAHTYIEYLEKAYGWDKVLSLIKTEDYETCFGKSQKAIYEEWVQFIKAYP